MDDKEAEALFSALANQDRLVVLKRLVHAGPSGMSAGAIAEAVSASPSRASFHLAALTEVGLIKRERKARQVIYSVNFARFGALAAYLLHDCCQDHPSARDCCGIGPSA